MATIKETSGNKKRAYQKATMKTIVMASKTSLLSGSGMDIFTLNNGWLQ